MTLEEGEIVLCTVDRIVGTVIFVKIEGNGEGNIITSEIAPGRIRNLRDYVVPKKKIVCKVLRIGKEKQIDLSMRRVTAKEKKEILQQYEQEKSAKNILKTILGEKAEKIIEEISKKLKINEFLQKAKESSKELEKLIGKENTEKILKILKTQKAKKGIIKKEFILKTKKSNGLTIIKKILDIPEAEVKYLAGGRYFIKAEADDFKQANNILQKALEEIKEKAKKEGCEFEIKEK